MFFMDRRDAGRQLAARLGHFKEAGVVVLGLPRGGVPVAAEVAEALGAPLDVCLVRKLGVPFQPELGMGAIGEGGVRVINDDVVRTARVTPDELAEVEARERVVLQSRARQYRGGREPIELEGRTVLVVDDGVATGSTARVACRIARARGAARIVLAVPAAPHDWTARLNEDADELVCLHTPRNFFAVGQFYTIDFSQVDDAEVVACLEAAAARLASNRPTEPGHAGPEDREVDVRVGATVLRGQLTVPEAARGVVVFAHGSGSSRHSPCNRFVAVGLNRAGLGTLLFDLLTEEEIDRANVFDTGLVARRLADVTGWVRRQPETAGLAVGYFGASTGSAAALWAAAEPGARIAAIVSLGGRPDLAGPRLSAVTAPTLLIVGGDDQLVLDLNREAQARLRCGNRLAIVPGATHLFEERGALEKARDLARDWFTDHMATASRAAAPG
ncbi:phosphoribosyltransferase family protein [Streptomyces sp. NBC_01340]|uniref:phosphoribosyltransferase family protein n=1 Tax=unclassified Streptomyces TaxID=2593676 RepID=UPI002253D6CF|nr:MULTISPECIES: phosphoribosyltransferase family protein [unclassified Streptomyces]MCX4458945.1 phosphoribosyltransferase family protein [Streptomyces sp. NBC_01719]MCX4498302.1 phosphoribosyltransferase family protein [Streptomyces sp. NBC_01728]WSI42816.1 phosphoribosyltransferase family protein [Streptomyces sp. NBC_01340]